MRITFHNLLFFLFLLSVIRLNGQETGDLRKNELLFPGNSRSGFDRLFRSFDNLILRGEGKINIVHIGDSHIQADFFPGQVRKRLVSEIASGSGARGLLFPYRIARTNNPADYLVKFTGNWESCRNVETGKNCSLGLTGIRIRTQDSLAEMTFHFRDAASPDFNSVMIFHDPGVCSFSLEFPGMDGNYSSMKDTVGGFTNVHFNQYLRDSLTVRIVRKDTLYRYFNLFGVEFDCDDPGIIYSSAGVNGAEVTSFLHCGLLPGQLAVFKPAFVILSLGTNDAYSQKFDRNFFRENYKELIRMVRRFDPDLPVLLTIPGDSYRKRRNDNKNLPALRQEILEVAGAMDCAVWDFYSLMGGAKSIQRWFKAGLASKDKIHFSRKGYVIQGDLLSDAILNAYSAYIDRSK